MPRVLPLPQGRPNGTLFHDLGHLGISGIHLHAKSLLAC